MSFDIDKQTLEDLNLEGKFRYGSAYSLFNKVKTRGGESLLHQMFYHPLDDADVINHRTKIFSFFQKEGIVFPFDAEQVHFMRDYLEGEARRSFILSFSDIGIKRALSILIRDGQYKNIVQGLQATIVTLHRCLVLVSNCRSENPFAERMKEIMKLLSDRRLESLVNTDIYKGLSIKNIAYYDHLIRRQLNRQIKDVLSFIYEFDVYIAVSNVADANGFAYAQALPGEANLLSCSDLKHPCIKGAVGNDILLNKDNNILFLTGANMAGKSTLMKSIGIGLYLAHIGFPVAAKKMEFSIREGLFSSINVADNIDLGYSHFYAEVIRVKHSAEKVASGKRLFLMFDELFKGTNVKDAFEGTLTIIKAFAEYHNCLFVVSTHIIEVGEALNKISNIQFGYMPTIMNANTPVYTYRLADGITGDRQGMLIIQNEGIFDLLDRKKSLQKSIKL